MKPEGVYKQVILTIQNRRHRPFAIHEVRRDCGIHATSVRRVLKRLQMMGYVFKTSTAFSGRFWRVTRRWPEGDVKQVIVDYEWHILVNRRLKSGLSPREKAVENAKSDTNR